MQIKTILLPFFAGILLTSCGGVTKENSAGQTSDSLEIHNKQLKKSVKLFKEAALPFVVDTTFIFKINAGDSLGGFEIKSLADKIFKHSLTDGLAYDLNAFYKIDSLKGHRLHNMVKSIHFYPVMEFCQWTFPGNGTSS